MIVNKIKKWLGDAYDIYGEKLKLNFIFGFIEKKSVRLGCQYLNENEFSISGDSDAVLLFSTSEKGVLFYKCGQIIQLTNDKSAYGITRSGDYWYVFYKTGRTGAIYRLQIEADMHVSVFQCVYYGLSRGIHQLDIYSGFLYAVDTYNNRIIKFADYEKRLNCYWRNSSFEEFFPAKRLGNRGRKSENYCHFNSIYMDSNNAMLVAHNETFKTGRSSQLYICDLKSFKVDQIIELKGGNCHNYYARKNRSYYCASLEQKIKSFHGNETFYDVNKFSRGLSVSVDKIIFGGSEVHQKRERRASGELVIIFLSSSNGCYMGDLKVRAGQVNDIRCYDEVDYALSSNSMMD